MQRTQIHVGQSLRQVQQFLMEHEAAVPSAAASAAKKTLDAAVAELDRAATEQGALARAGRGEVQRRVELERTLIRKYLTPLVKFARASLRGAPEFASLTPPSKALQRERLARTAQAMAVAADQHADALKAGEFPADFVAQLRATATAVQTSFDVGRSGRVRRTGVTKAIRAALANGRQAVAALDALIAHTIVGDEALEREWRAAKRVRRRGVATEAADPEAAPEADPEVAPEVAPAVASAVASAVVSAAVAGAIMPSAKAPVAAALEVSAAA